MRRVQHNAQATICDNVLETFQALGTFKYCKVPRETCGLSHEPIVCSRVAALARGLPYRYIVGEFSIILELAASKLKPMPGELAC